LYHFPVMKLQRYSSVLAVSCCAVWLAAQSKPALCGVFQSAKDNAVQVTIEQSIKGFLYSLYAAESVEFHKWIIPEPGSDELVRTNRLTAPQLEELRRDVDSIQLRQVYPFVAEGNELRAVPASGFSIGTRTTYTTAFRGSAIAIPVVYTESGWRVDIRFWLAMKRQAEGALKQTDPEVVAKAFLYYILAKQPQKLQRLSASAIKAEEYTAANNLPGGDLDQILSLCIEMAIVRARVGETFRMPSGEIVRVGKQPDTLILVGMLGTAEVAFQLKQVGGEWKVVPQRYFEMLRRAGAI
jgi:hypothetical protein